ncbi:MAG: hypothetical protein J6A01_02010 [Proteobacteria bacterium]|nr:hypothetical protein [Pseudomonadota bacterium]
MRKLAGLIVLACLSLIGCEDSNDKQAMCDKYCGHGACYYNATAEVCNCDKEYTTDSEGLCTLCKSGYHLVKTECVPDSICTGQCEGEHRTCTVVGNTPQCGCEMGYAGKDVCTATQDCFTTFVYENPNATGQKVYVTGSFDEWQHSTYQLDEQSPGRFIGTFLIDPGVYNYKFFVAGWGNENGWKTAGDENGDDLALWIQPCSKKVGPKLKLSSSPVVSNNTVSFDVSLVDPYHYAGDVKIQVEANGIEIASVPGTLIHIQNPMDGRKGVYVIKATSSNNVEIEPLYVPVWNESKPFDWGSAILYFAFTDRFFNGNTQNDAPLGIANDWMGGDFAGLRAKVEAGYFDRLGVTALWISSVSMNTQKAAGTASAYHSYWPITTGYSDKTASMFAGAQSNGVALTPIEPHFGSLDELRALVKSCHDRGIRVLVDFAANHVADDSPVYLQHPEWFNFSDRAGDDSILCEGPYDAQGNLSQANWNIIPETCWFDPNLPDFNYNLPEVREFVLEHAKWLIRTTGIDGFRLDAVKHMPIEFIRELRMNIDEMMAASGQTFYIVGETFDGAWKIKQYIGSALLHGQFDFPLYNKLRESIMNGDGKFWDLKDFVTGDEGDGSYGSAIMSTFLGNHDVARAISHIHHDAEDKKSKNPEVTDAWAYRQLKLAWVFLMTSPNIPMIYYGDEFGLEGANDPDNRRMMKFDNALNPQQADTLALVQKLGTLRHAHPALYHGKRQNIDAYDRSYMYLMQGDGETILVGISDSDEDQTYTVNVGTKGWINLLNESEPVYETNTITLTKDRHIIVWKLKD